MGDRRVVYFNNCSAFDHAAAYGKGAFFDLNQSGRQLRMARDLPKGQTCIVATPNGDGLVEFCWWSFEREKLVRFAGGKRVRVFFGRSIRTEKIPKLSATKHKQYDQFFDVNGHFKRPASFVMDLSSHRPLIPEEVDPSVGPHFEGATRQITVNAYERNPEARRKCISHYGAVCSVCKTRLEDIYGSLAEGYIHVHHMKPLSSIRKHYRVDPIKDLRPVCPNCHAIIHLGGECRTIAEVKRLMQSINHKTH